MIIPIPHPTPPLLPPYPRSPPLTARPEARGWKGITEAEVAMVLPLAAGLEVPEIPAALFIIMQATKVN